MNSECFHDFKRAGRCVQANIHNCFRKILNKLSFFQTSFWTKKSILAPSALKHVYVRQLPLPNANYDALLKRMRGGQAP